MRAIRFLTFAAPLAVVACSGNDAPTGTTGRVQTPPAAGQPASNASIRLDVSGAVDPLFINTLTTVQLTATASDGTLMSATETSIDIANSAVLAVDSVYPIPMQKAAVRADGKAVILRGIAPGSSTVSFQLGNHTRTLLVTVLAESPSSALVVESFEVIEYRDVCAWACPYLVYAPQIKLREPTGVSSATVTAMQFSLGGRSTAMCRGERLYDRGVSAHLNGIDPYLWANDQIIVSLDGSQLPGEDATAFIVVRDHAGNSGVIRAKGKIRRMVSNPVLAPPVNDAWTCTN